MLPEKVTLMAARRTILKSQKGAALVEMALVAPIIIVVLFAILEFGWIIYSKGVITNASREGARMGVVLREPRWTEADVTDTVQDYLEKSGFNPADVQVNFPDGPPGDSGDPFVVRLQYTYNFHVLPNFIQNLTGSVGLTAETVMCME
jgi:Flp pilus assembly protein TadG